MLCSSKSGGVEYHKEEESYNLDTFQNFEEAYVHMTYQLFLQETQQAVLSPLSPQEESILCSHSALM